MSDWRTALSHDPLPALVESQDPRITFFVKRDLLGQNVNAQDLWELSGAHSITRKQQSDGSWKYPGGNHKLRSAEDYNQLETFRNLGFLVELFGFDRRAPAISDAATFMLSFQTTEGDIRGILGNQYAPYYTAAIMELLVKAGYGDDPRLQKAFKWLWQIRQNDGGWAIPLRTQNRKLDIIALPTKTVGPDKTRPFSHLVTGMVLRAYAAHSKLRHSPEANQAGKLLLSRLFKPDAYPDRRGADYWLRFTFPFWFTDLISAMDSLSLLGFTRAEPLMDQAIQWFAHRQQPSGLWHLPILKNPHQNNDLWLSLAICRILVGLYN